MGFWSREACYLAGGKTDNTQIADAAWLTIYILHSECLQMYLYIINDRSRQCQTSMLIMPAGAVGSQHQYLFDRNSAHLSNTPGGWGSCTVRRVVGKRWREK